MFLLSLTLACGPKQKSSEILMLAPADLAPREELIEDVHGISIADPYRWMEESSPALQSWIAARNEAFGLATNELEHRDFLYERFQALWRYDDTSIPEPCILNPERSIFYSKKADQDKWVVHFKTPESESIIIDPNSWEPTQTLSGFYPSPDCQMAAYGVANAGDENPVIHIMDMETLEILPDQLKGWKQRSVSWLPDNSGFYYSSWPTAEEAPNGEKDYYHRSLFHVLGQEGQEDVVVLNDTEVKEHFHNTWVTEDGQWIISGRFSFNASRLWLQAVGSEEKFALNEEMDAEYSVDVYEDNLYILTNLDAPKYRLMKSPVTSPHLEDWEEIIPESNDILESVAILNGRLYLTYQHNATTKIERRGLDGSLEVELEFPSVGSASISGLQNAEPVYLSFSSFAHPKTIYTYDESSNELTVFKESPLDVDVSNIESEQVFYESKDGTKVSMFLIYPKGINLDGSTPFLLTGYGGFNISLKPRFSTRNSTWLEMGGGIAIPNLRGGGEYGREWHEAGMLDNKQNVFDDFISAAEYLEAQGYTQRDRLGISGGSNGGLLVSAVVTQRPELFAAVLCNVPLTDMVRYHRFGLANIWSEEYGNSEDPEQAKYLHDYSPYHNVQRGVDYPAILVTGSANDARTSPVHAQKFAAAIRWADQDNGMLQPILLSIQEDSGHGGGVGIDIVADQMSRQYGFVANQIGLAVPSESQGE